MLQEYLREMRYSTDAQFETLDLNYANVIV